jgi:hypothetical protein
MERLLQAIYFLFLICLTKRAFWVAEHLKLQLLLQPLGLGQGLQLLGLGPQLLGLQLLVLGLQLQLQL